MDAALDACTGYIVHPRNCHLPPPVRPPNFLGALKGSTGGGGGCREKGEQQSRIVVATCAHSGSVLYRHGIFACCTAPHRHRTASDLLGSRRLPATTAIVAAANYSYGRGQREPSCFFRGRRPKALLCRPPRGSHVMTSWNWPGAASVRGFPFSAFTCHFLQPGGVGKGAGRESWNTS